MSDLKKPVSRSLPNNEYDLAHQQSASFPVMATSSNSDSLSDSLRTESHIAVLDLREAAAVLHCHPKTLRLMAKAKKIPALRVGKLWRFSEKRLREWLEAS